METINIVKSYDFIFNKDTFLTTFSSSSASSCESSSYNTSCSSFYLNSTSKFEKFDRNNTRNIINMIQPIVKKQALKKSVKTRKHKSFSLLKSKILNGKLFKKSDKKILISTEHNLLKKSIKIEKKEESKIVGKIHKIMDKSLGWFNKSKKSNKKIKKRMISSQCSSYSDLNSICQTKSQFNESFSSNQQIIDNEISDLNDKFYLKKSYQFSAPSMCSSFDVSKSKLNENILEELYHSTPRSLYHQFSPIENSNVSVENVSTSRLSDSFSVLSFTPNLNRRRLSFGVTSSPVSLNQNISDDSQNKSNFIDVRLLEHINEIKKNIKIGVESRNLKRNFNNIDTVSSDDLSWTRIKRRKLKQIFQIKLKKQLKEIKKWQIGIQKELVFDDNDLYFSTNKKHQKYSKRHSSYFAKRRNDDFTTIKNYDVTTNFNCNCNNIYRENIYRPKIYHYGSKCSCHRCFNIKNNQFHQDYFYNNYYQSKFDPYTLKNEYFLDRIHFQNMHPAYCQNQKNWRKLKTQI